MTDNKNKKTVLLCVTGGIAAFKAVQLASDLIKNDIDVEVVMSKNATEFIQPLSFEAITHHSVIVDTFDNRFSKEVEHISLAERADLVVVVPATANVIAKLNSGIADDMLTTTILASIAPKIICPAMNTNMYNSSITQKNIAELKGYGYKFIEPETGLLACGTNGKGKLAQIDTIKNFILKELSKINIIHSSSNVLLDGIKVLVSAGPTQEAIDPVRYITNHSTGKMGYSIAEAFANRGAEVTLVTGPTNIEPPKTVEIVKIKSALELNSVMLEKSPQFDIIVMTAAVADYRPERISENKIKKKDGDLTIKLVRNPDILLSLGAKKTKSQVLCGFAMETEDLISRAEEKLHKKNCDMIVANNLKEKGAGFACNTNKVVFIEKNGNIQNSDLMSKKEIAEQILDRLVKIYKNKN